MSLCLPSRRNSKLRAVFGRLRSWLDGFSNRLRLLSFRRRSPLSDNVRLGNRLPIQRCTIALDASSKQLARFIEFLSCFFSSSQLQQYLAPYQMHCLAVRRESGGLVYFFHGHSRFSSLQMNLSQFRQRSRQPRPALTASVKARSASSCLPSCWYSFPSCS